MRSVSLSNSAVQERIKNSFVPLKVSIERGTSKFPLDWPAMKSWKLAYALMGGARVKGITGCCVITPDLEIELANTGSAYVWELFESIAYDADKFASMLDKSLERFTIYQQIQSDPSLSRWKRRRLLKRQKRSIKRAIRKDRQFHLPPPGFSARDAVELFKISGDLPSKSAD